MSNALVFKPFPPSYLSHWGWLDFSGPDAADFLHRLTTANIKTLREGFGTPACFLSASGKISAYFWLWRYGKENFGIEFDAGTDSLWKKSLLKTIETYT